MNCRIVLLDLDIEFGASMEAYFRKKKESGELKNWELVYLEKIKDYSLLNTDENWDDFFLLGEDFSEKELMVKVAETSGLQSKDLKIGFLTGTQGEPLYRYGGPERMVLEIERRLKNVGKGGRKIEKKTTLTAGVGLAGGVGNTTLLLSISDTLRARGFKTIYIDLNYWGNLKKYLKDERVVDLSYLRFVYNRDPLNFEKAMSDVIEESGEGGSLLVGPIFE